MIDHGFTSGGQINRAFALLMLVAVVLALATAARFFFVSLLGEKVVADLRSRLYAHLIQLGAGFHDRSRSGELVSRLTADSELLRSVVGSTMSVALRSVTVVGSLAMLFVTSPRLAAWSLLGIPLAVLPIIIGARKLRTVARSSQDRIADANTWPARRWAPCTVQAHAREPYERGRFDKALGDAIGAARRRIGAQSLVTASAILLVFGAIVGVLWLGAHDVIDGRLCRARAGAVRAVRADRRRLGRAGRSVERTAAQPVACIGELLQEDIEIRAPRSSTFCRNHCAAKSSSTWCSTIRNVRTRPRWTTSTCMSGETVVLVGLSGAGKSTVLSMLLRFHDPPAAASAWMASTYARSMPSCARSWRWCRSSRRCSRPVRATTSAMAACECDAEVEAAARAAEADGFLRALPQGYDSELGERGARLSGGQQQRVAIARALLKDAPILLLDEAPARWTHERAQRAAGAGAAMAGRTTVVIAHRLATVPRPTASW